MKKILGITLVVALLLGMLTGCSGKKPSTITMSAAEVNEKGVVLKRCEITLEITQESNARQEYTPYECTVSFSGMDAPLTGCELSCDRHAVDTAWLFVGFGYNPAKNDMDPIVLYMDGERENCLIEVEENERYFVASIDPDFDPMKLYKSLSEELSERHTYIHNP